MSQTASETPLHDVRGVLAITPFRRLWLSLTISSFGDWLGLLATTAMAAYLGSLDSYAKANLAVSAVLILRLLPAIVFGPLAGAVADRLNRRTTMVVGDVLRGALFVSIPVVNTLTWLFVATLLIEVVSLFWTPAKDASVPNLVPRQRLEAANQLSLAATYGSAPVAALAFSGLALLSGVLVKVVPVQLGPNDLALYLNAASYFWAAFVVARLELAPFGARKLASAQHDSLWTTLLQGWRFVSQTPLIRGLVLGMLGAFGAGGFVIGVAPMFVRDLGAGSPGYGVLFAAVFTGLALGMWLGPRLLRQLPRWRLFALAIVFSGVFLATMAVVHFMAVAAVLTLFVGIGAGMAWVTGYTMLGLEVEDELRGRTFAFVQSAARVVLVAVMALAPGLAALLGNHTWDLTPRVTIHFDGTGLTLLVAAGLAIWIGIASYRTMDDHGEVSLRDDLLAAVLPRTIDTWWMHNRRHDGLFIAFEGGDGAGKSTQVQALRRHLVDELGQDVVITREPGATELGKQIRTMLLHGGEVDPRAEALMFAADRAQHVAELIQPALDRGAVVITDRYVDSSVAYQGSGRELGPEQIVAVSEFATRGLLPDLTILLDLDPDTSAERRSARGGTDRMEAQDRDFHDRVRQMFLSQSRRNPRRYLVLDATRQPEELATEIAARVDQMVPHYQATTQPHRRRWRSGGRRTASRATSGAAPAAQGVNGTQPANTTVLLANHPGPHAADPANAPTDPANAPTQRLDPRQPEPQHRHQADLQQTEPEQPRPTTESHHGDDWNAPWAGR